MEDVSELLTVRFILSIRVISEFISVNFVNFCKHFLNDQKVKNSTLMSATFLSHIILLYIGRG